MPVVVGHARAAQTLMNLSIDCVKRLADVAEDAKPNNEDNERVGSQVACIFKQECDQNAYVVMILSY